MKTCTKCGEAKAPTEFHRTSHAKCGLTHNCKSCRSLAAKEYKKANPERAAEVNKRKCETWRKRNREKYIESSNRWIKRNPELAKEYMRLCRVKNKEKIREYGAEYFRRNKERLVEASRLWRDSLPDRYVLGLMRKYEIPPQLLEAKREQLRLLRLTKELTHAINDRKETT
jgi:hypothetical protein